MFCCVFLLVIVLFRYIIVFLLFDIVLCFYKCVVFSICPCVSFSLFLIPVPICCLFHHCVFLFHLSLVNLPVAFCASGPPYKTPFFPHFLCIYSQTHSNEPTASPNKCPSSFFLLLNLLIVNDRTHCSLLLLLLLLSCGFTPLIPEGPRVWHSSHSDLSPSSVTYYRRLLSLHNHFTARHRERETWGEEDETRLTPTNSC